MIFINNMGRRPSIVHILFAFFVFFAFLYVGIYIAKWFLYLLGVIAPVLLIAAAFLNFSTLKNFVRYLWGLIRNKPVFGLLLTILAIVGFPITAAVLFLRARSQYLKRRTFHEKMTADGSEYIDYEIIDERGNNRGIGMKNDR